MKSVQTLKRFFAGMAAATFLAGSVQAEPLKIAYSDWPGWVAWEIAIANDWFEEEGVEVEFLWFDYVASMDAYVAGATGKPSAGGTAVGTHSRKAKGTN